MTPPARDTTVEITIKKVGENDGGERFVLVDATTRKVLTVRDTSEKALRRFFEKRGTGAASIDACLRRARERYAATMQTQPVVDQASDTAEDDILSGLGLDDEL